MQNLNKEDANLRSFLDYLYIEKGLSQNTVKAYEVDLLAFISWITDNTNTDVINIKEDNINKYISYLFKTKLKSSSVNRKISSIKSFYLFLIKKNIVNTSPISEVISPKQEKYLPSSMSLIVCYWRSNWRDD